ncbi:MAG: hypothetical protein ACYC6N_26945 [Pirellulaceae bacterium]
MRVLPMCCAVGFACAGWHVLSQAQEVVGGVPWGGNNYNYQAHASTAAEGAARGAADVIQAAGAANLMNSMAAINTEQARSQYIDNRLKGTKTYFEMKQYNKDYRAANQAPRPTSEQLFRLAKAATPKKLGPDSLDPVTGAIKWPDVLATEDFSECREALDSLYAERANASGKINLEQFNAIRQSIGQMRALLKAKLNDLPPQVFSQANAFIKQLEYTAQLTG